MVNYYNLASTSLEHVQTLIQNDFSLSKPELENLQNSLREIEKTIKTKSKKNSVKISKLLLRKIQEHCEINNTELSVWIEKALTQGLENEKQNPFSNSDLKDDCQDSKKDYLIKKKKMKSSDPVITSIDPIL